MASRNPVERMLLRIDLRRKTSEREPIPREYVETMLGGRALAAMLLYRELAVGIDALGPENKLILSTGPLTGTGAFGSHHYCVTTKSPLTGLYLDTLSSGYFGRELKWTGNDVVIIEGKSEEPLYVVITEDGVTFQDGKPVWSMGTGEAQAFIRKSMSGQKVVHSHDRSGR